MSCRLPNVTIVNEQRSGGLQISRLLWPAFRCILYARQVNGGHGSLTAPEYSPLVSCKFGRRPNQNQLATMRVFVCQSDNGCRRTRGGPAVGRNNAKSVQTRE